MHTPPIKAASWVVLYDCGPVRVPDLHETRVRVQVRPMGSIYVGVNLHPFRGKSGFKSEWNVFMKTFPVVAREEAAGCGTRRSRPADGRETSWIAVRTTSPHARLNRASLV